MSLGKLSNLTEVIGRRKSVDAHVEDQAKRTQGDQDYVLVDDSEKESNISQEEVDDVNLALDKITSPSAVPLALKAPSEHSSDDWNTMGGAMDFQAMAAIRHQLMSEEDIPIDPLPQSLELNFDHLPVSAKEGDETLHRALEEAKEQHQWAMQAVIRGWEAEKKDLLNKLETVIEARDTLEAELKHSEHSFAGMLEGILDQKLDYMMHVLQESNLSRSASMSSPFGSSSQSSILNAQQVADDLGTMLDTMKAQQAAIEGKVATMQSAVLQLVPASTDDNSEETVQFPKAVNTPEKRSSPFRALALRVRQPLAAGANAVAGKVSYLRYKVPELSVAAAQKTGSVFRQAASSAKVNAVRAAHFCQQRGPKRHHIQAAVLLVAGGVIATLLKSSTPLREVDHGYQYDAPLQPDTQERELEVFEADPEEESILDQSVEIILNRNGVFKRYGSGPDSTSMVLAWPRISVDYN